MKAITNMRYGGPEVLVLQDLAKPMPKDDEVLVKVYATGLNYADYIHLTGKPLFVRPMVGGVFKPKVTVIGSDIAGIVEAVGKDVQQFKVGDEVFGETWGGFAEYVCAKEKQLALKPKSLSFEQAAALPMAGMTALQALKQKPDLAGKQVLVYGASGGVGSFAVQLAKALGAEVTAVCSTGKMGMLASLGADSIIDYTQEDFSQRDERYDLIIGANGYRSLDDYLRALKPDGLYVATGGKMRQIFEPMLLGKWKARKTAKTLSSLVANASQEHLIELKELVEAGKFVPMIDRVYPLEKAAEAMGYLGGRRARAKIIITLT
ncbi:MAG: NAD(P)-dependent alcohol dehydrogenase [Deinococcales bacterium]